MSYYHPYYNQRISGGGFPFPGGGIPIPGGGGFPVPGGGPPMPGGGPPTTGGGPPAQGNGAPTSPPPQQIPSKPQKPGGGFTYLVDPVVLQPCLYKKTYVWLTNGSSFWFYPTVLGNNSAGGYYWDWNTFKWVYYALDTKYIDVVSCS